MHFYELFLLHCTKPTEPFYAVYRRQNLSALLSCSISEQTGKQEGWPKHLNSMPAFKSKNISSDHYLFF